MAVVKSLLTLSATVTSLPPMIGGGSAPSRTPAHPAVGRVADAHFP
jgi:hypothetical protein